MPANVKIVIDGARMHELLRGPTGVIWPFMLRRAEVYAAAVRRDQPRRTGCLQDNTHKRIEEGPNGVAIRFIASTAPCSPTRTEYALFVHEGTAAHDIPNAFGYGPTFGIGGRFGGKFHPGAPARRFFTDNFYVWGEQGALF